MGPLPSFLFVLAIASFYTVSGGMLWLLGYNYDGLTGSPLTKIHPGTYLTLIVLCMAAVEQGNPIAFAVESARRQPASLFLLFAALVRLRANRIAGGPGLAGTIDAFMLPPLAIILYAKSGETTRRRIEIVIHVAMVLNASLALVEFATKHLYFPFRLDGVDYVTDTRSSALQGHPLGNATITCVYILALISGGGRMPVLVRTGVVVLQLMAMVAFGGRSALVTTIAFAGLQGCLAAHRILRSGTVPLLGMAAAVLVATITPLVLLGLVAGGFFDALLVRFSNDGGSANARVEMLELGSAHPAARPDRGSGHGLCRERASHLRACAGHREPDRPQRLVPGRDRDRSPHGGARVFLQGVDPRCPSQHGGALAGLPDRDQHVREHRGQIDHAGQHRTDAGRSLQEVCRAGAVAGSGDDAGTGGKRSRPRGNGAIPKRLAGLANLPPLSRDEPRLRETRLRNACPALTAAVP